MNQMNHHGVSFNEFRAGAAGTTAVCLVQTLLMQGMIHKAERDLEGPKDEQHREQAIRLAYERNRVRD